MDDGSLSPTASLTLTNHTTASFPALLRALQLQGFVSIEMYTKLNNRINPCVAGTVYIRVLINMNITKL